MKLGKKNVIRKETLLVWPYLCLAIGLFVQKERGMVPNSR